MDNFDPLQGVPLRFIEVVIDGAHILRFYTDKQITHWSKADWEQIKRGVDLSIKEKKSWISTSAVWGS